jgi:hypothetical protein
MDNSRRGFPGLVGSGCVGSVCLGVGDASADEGDWLVDLADCFPDAFVLIFLGFFISSFANAENARLFV